MSIEILKFTADDLNAEFAQCQTLGEIVTELEKKVRSRGRVVCNVSVNGMRFNEADEQRLAMTSVRELQNLTIESEEPEELVRSTIFSQLQLCAELQRASLITAEAFRGLDLHPAQTHLIALLDGCRWFTDGLAALKAAPAVLMPESFDQVGWDKSETEFRRVVCEIMGAVERTDYVLIADVLEYDLGNALDGWGGLLAPLAKNSPRAQP
jgi:hypothetical protein